MTQIDPRRTDDSRPAADDGEPVFDKGQDDLPWPQDDALPMDDEMNILPGNDTLDDDPNDNGDQEQNDPEDHKNLPI